VLAVLPETRERNGPSTHLRSNRTTIGGQNDSAVSPHCPIPVFGRILCLRQRILHAYSEDVLSDHHRRGAKQIG